MTALVDPNDGFFSFPCGGGPFRVGDRFRYCTDVGPGVLVQFVRVDDDYVEVQAADESMRNVADVFRCEGGPLPGEIVFIPVPRLAS